MDKQKLIAILDKNIDQKGLVLDLLEEYVKPAVMDLAKKTTNTLDDRAAELLLEEIKELIEKQLGEQPEVTA